MLVPTGPKSFDSQGFLVTAAPACTTVGNAAASTGASGGTSSANVVLALQEGTDTGSATVVTPTASSLATVSTAAVKSSAQRNHAGILASLVAFVSGLVIFLRVV